MGDVKLNISGKIRIISERDTNLRTSCSLEGERNAHCYLHRGDSRLEHAFRASKQGGGGSLT